MNKTRKIIIVVSIIVVMPATTYSFSPAMHMYIGQETIDIWEENQ